MPIKRDYMFLEAVFSSFKHIMLRDSVTVFFFFVLQLRDKRKRTGATPLRTHFLYWLGVNIPKLLYSEAFHSQPKPWGLEHKGKSS